MVEVRFKIRIVDVLLLIGFVAIVVALLCLGASGFFVLCLTLHAIFFAVPFFIAFTTIVFASDANGALVPNSNPLYGFFKKLWIFTFVALIILWIYLVITGFSH